MTIQNVHSAKILQEANKLFDSFHSSGSLNDHNPFFFFIRAEALGAMVNLLAYSLVFRGVRADLAKGHRTLATGVWSLLSDTCVVAVSIVKEIKSAARRVFNIEFRKLQCVLEL